MEYKFLASYILILIALYFSYREKLGLEKTILINSIRALLQLAALGYLLFFVFKLKNPVALVMILVFMVVFAAWTGQRRVRLADKGFLTAFQVIFLASFIVISSLLLMGIITFEPNQIIPVGGMVIGNSLNVYTLALDRMKGETKNTLDIIEGVVALGGSLKDAFYFIRKESLKASLIPILNSLQTVGIIHIPGITTGMLLAGADPFEAVSYQLAIMYMMVAVALFTGLFSINYGYKKIIRTVTEG
ncbi:iron export ABC transporter permease subunit FetB [Persephonella sp. KM09-Lau-8]|uniref:ABC transporter permease n=1 Tax=Persephonella sp. KM09-Lau-8 TaxID=1158345 RepID=UPI000A6724E7|nr:iron export ABC transporter permease subunit FetB [Persephonella sp. KM09-Lau-8]